MIFQVYLGHMMEIKTMIWLYLMVQWYPVYQLSIEAGGKGLHVHNFIKPELLKDNIKVIYCIQFNSCLRYDEGCEASKIKYNCFHRYHFENSIGFLFLFNTKWCKCLAFLKLLKQS